MSLRLVKYGIVGLIPFAANALTIILLTHLGVGVVRVTIPDFSIENAMIHLVVTEFGFGLDIATCVSFAIGGQVAFWGHDRLTFSDRHVSLRGWRRRWRRFMPGQFGGLGLNLLTGLLLATFTDTPRLVAWFLCTFAGVIGTFSWTNWISHRAPTPDYPVIHPREEPQE